jgi:prolyl-tRNA synthetase
MGSQRRRRERPRRDEAVPCQNATADYAAPTRCPIIREKPAAGDDLRQSRGIEVGHIFYFGDKYSARHGPGRFKGSDGKPVDPADGQATASASPPRRRGSSKQATTTPASVWPDAGGALFASALVNMRADDAACTQASDALYARLEGAGVETLYDDRDERGGVKFAPWT